MRNYNIIEYIVAKTGSNDKIYNALSEFKKCIFAGIFFIFRDFMVDFRIAVDHRNIFSKHGCIS